jgi:hypothetical protein
MFQIKAVDINTIHIPCDGTNFCMMNYFLRKCVSFISLLYKLQVMAYMNKHYIYMTNFSVDAK